MIRQLFQSLRGRLLLANLLVSAFILLSLIGNSIYLSERHLEAQSRKSLVDTGNIYIGAIVPYLMSRDYNALAAMMEEWMTSDAISYLVILDGNKRLVSVNWPEEKELPAEGTIDFVQHVIIPVMIGDQVYGELHIGHSIAFISEMQRDFLMQGILIAVVGLLFLILLQSFIIYYLMRGLSMLSEVSIQVARGDFRQIPETSGKDEISTLTRNFNKMVGFLQDKVRDLEEGEQRFRAIADYTYSWESWFSSDGKLTWVNSAVQRLTGYTPEECLNMQDYPLGIAHESDRELIRHMLEQAADGHSGQDLEFRVQCRNNRVIWVAASWQSIYNDNGYSLGFRVSIRDITLQHYANEELVYQAAHDPLTSLNNRRSFERQLQQDLEASRLDRKPVIVLYLDLDQFKVVNDTCGHVAGDQLLINLSKFLQVSHNDYFLARLGGDEFGIILRDCDISEAVQRARFIIDEIRAFPFIYSGHTFRLGASAGIVRAGPGLDNFTSILIAADTACYAAKERGRNRVEVYSEEDEYFRLRNEEFRSIGQITSALSEGRFLLYFQRVEPLSPNLPRHVEILIRLRDLLGNVQAPGRFIAAAERFSLMSYIDRWVVENVCRQIAEWDKSGIRPDVSRFTINVSGSSLSDQDFPAFVQSQIKEFGIDSRRLGFELTESQAVSQLDHALEFINQMRSIQASLLLDDFGSGMASFAYLKKFKVDYLKIDGMFIKNLHIDEDDRAVARSMVQLAKAYKLRTVAEFVSNEAICEIIKELGIDYAQGYVYHVPEPISNLGSFV